MFYIVCIESLQHNFSPNCTNTKKVCFSIHSNLFMLWGVQITCFWDCLLRKFYYTSFPEIVHTLPKFVFAVVSLDNLFRLWVIQIMCFWDLLDRIFYYVTFHQILQTLRKFAYRFVAIFLCFGSSNNVFLDHLYRIFYYVTFHQILQTLR